MRKLKNLKQAFFSEKIGVGRTTISNYEANVSQPDIETLIKIAKLLDISIDDLLLNDLTKTEFKSYNYKNEVNEDSPPYNCIKCSEKEKLITYQKQTIEALQIATEALKSQVEILKNKDDRIESGQKRKAS